ncbi:glypican-1-like [Paramormyrops kingsleyae]|uniref:Glypican-1 n=1 Tax=Paramormyrops kingsleyae TaxID=1676925 RepID=A0A3B3RC80_9TELE|nr:glypican-1-like [Paramormyrops kingsleyae]
MDAPLALLICLLAVPAVANDGKPRSCSSVRQFYIDKGFSQSWVPRIKISGEHLRICPQGYTCCVSEMEESLWNMSQREFKGQVRDLGHALQASLSTLYGNFDGYFAELLNRSEGLLQDWLGSTPGELYAEGAAVSRELYTDLRRYHRGSGVNLEEALNDFWPRLLERLFRVWGLQEPTTGDFLECLAKQMEALRPFGDAPRDLRLRVKRVFVAVRSFVQGLSVSHDVVHKVSQVPLSSECTRAIMKMTYCPQCHGIASIKPCANYCRNVMKGCLANQADLQPEWSNLIFALLQMATRFISGDSRLDVSIFSIPQHISDGIMNMQENRDIFTSKVSQACGSPQVRSTHSTRPEEAKKPGTTLDSKVPNILAARLEGQMSQVNSKLTEKQSYWVQLPEVLCGDKEEPSISKDKCWNGMTKGRYLPEEMGDGLANQINNPEVEMDITKPDMNVRQQIMQLKIMTSRLKNAFDGNDVDFQDASDDISGSGSGACIEEHCPRGDPCILAPRTDRPGPYAYTPEKKAPAKDTGSQGPPSTPPLLLSLAVLLLWR